MANLKGTEKKVAESLVSHFSKSNRSVSFEEGNDPPDIYLNIDGKKISVEITDIDQNVLKNRKTVDYGYLKFIVNLDKELGSLITGDKKLFLMFYHSYHKVSAIKKVFKNCLKSIIEEKRYETSGSIEGDINGVNFKISTFNMPKNGSRKIAGGVAPYGGKVKKSRDINTALEEMSDYNLTEQTLAIIQERISNKNEKCQGVEKPIWLAFYDNYYKYFTYFGSSDHIEHYKNISKGISHFGCFEKILVVFENGDILDLST
jgi:hypothetical protein